MYSKKVLMCSYNAKANDRKQSRQSIKYTLLDNVRPFISNNGLDPRGATMYLFNL